MTSGNAGDEPICRENREALERLRPFADLFLLHDRDVVRRVDDSVVRAVPKGHVLVRRSRGYVPEPVPLPAPTPEPVLALGGHLQVVACLASEEQAFPSQHVGDLDTDAARAFLLEVAAGLEEFLEVEARVVAVDLHPDYPSTWAGERLARERGARLLRVQHHVAHAAAVLAEHGAFPGPGARAGAIVLDGTGYGPDGAAWGGEWLVLDGTLGWSRQAHLPEVPLVGGERAVREPWRVAVAALALERADDLLSRLPIAARVDPARLEEVARLAREGSWPRATGAGRIFEAAGALLGLTAENTWEGEAAARLEALASTAEDVASWPEAEGPAPGPRLLAAAARRLAAGEHAARVAAGFHATFCALAAELAARAFPSDVRRVALGGGCFVNRLLLEGLERRLREGGFEVLVPRRLPPGDGGLSYGQAALAALALSRGSEPVQKGAL
jgi:hydrogenase maturation protein HypF